MTLQEVLRGGRQCDEDGVEIIMSREACVKAADALDEKDRRIEELKGALMKLCIASQSLDNAFSYECRFRDNDRYPLVANGLVVLRTILDGSRAALKGE